MGRSKISLKPIKDEKSRKATMIQRSKGLMKKISEISTLCEVEACLIVYDKNSDAQPATWPKDHKVVHSILEKYESQKDEKGVKIYNLEDYFDNKKGIIEAEISKVKKEIQKIKYPTWDPCFKGMGDEQMKDFIAMLNDKIGACNNRMNMLKSKQQSEANFSFMQNMAQQIPNQFSFMQNQMVPSHMSSYSDSNEMVDSTNQVDVALDSMNSPLYLAGQLGGPLDLDTSLLANVDYWAHFLDDYDDFLGWANQSSEYSLHDTNGQQGAFLPLPMGGF